MTGESSYDYGIRVQRSKPPMDDVYPYAAKLTYFHRKVRGGVREVEAYFGEVYAKTEQEAREKMRKKVEGWIASYGSGSSDPQT